VRRAELQVSEQRNGGGPTCGLVRELDGDLEELKIGGAAGGAGGKLVGETPLLEEGEQGSLRLVPDEVGEVVRGLLEIVLVSRGKREYDAQVAQVLDRHDLEQLALMNAMRRWHTTSAWVAHATRCGELVTCRKTYQLLLTERNNFPVGEVIGPASILDLGKTGHHPLLQHIQRL
jgi:hypothetical protein